MKQQVRRIVPLLLAVSLLAYALKDISFGVISKQFRQADYKLIALAGLVTIGSYFLRGKRWQQPLRALGYHPTTFRTTVAMQTGLVASMVVIGSGEITRCVTLQRTDGVPFSQGIGSVVAERIIDLFMLLIVLLLTVLLEFGRMRRYVADLTLTVPSTYLILGILSVVGLTILTSWWLLSKSAVRHHPFIRRIINVFQGFSKGFLAIRQLPQPGLFVVLTFLNQIFSWLGTYLLLLAVDSIHTMPPTAALTIMAASSVGGLAVPTQGGIGTYHFMVSRVLMLYGFSETEGVATATFMHAVGFGINLVLSSISFLIVPVLITAKQSAPAASVLKSER